MPDEVMIYSLLGSWLYGSMIHATAVLRRDFEADIAAIRLFELKNVSHTSYVDTASLGLTIQQDKAAQAWASQQGSLMDHVRHNQEMQIIYRPAALLDMPSNKTAQDSPEHASSSPAKQQPPVKQSGKQKMGSAARVSGKISGLGASVISDQLQWPDKNGKQPQSQSQSRVRDMFKGLVDGKDSQIKVTDCLCTNMKVFGDVWAALALIRCQTSAPFGDKHLHSLKQIKPAVAHTLRSGCARQGLNDQPVTSRKRGGSAAKRWTTDQIIAKLTRTECQVLGYLRLSATEREISQEVHRSPHTVHVHVKNIYRKLDVTSRGELLELFGDTLRD